MPPPCTCRIEQPETTLRTSTHYGTGMKELRKHSDRHVGLTTLQFWQSSFSWGRIMRRSSSDVEKRVDASCDVPKLLCRLLTLSQMHLLGMSTSHMPLYRHPPRLLITHSASPSVGAFHTWGWRMLDYAMQQSGTSLQGQRRDGSLIDNAVERS